MNERGNISAAHERRLVLDEAHGGFIRRYGEKRRPSITVGVMSASRCSVRTEGYVESGVQLGE